MLLFSWNAFYHSEKVVHRMVNYPIALTRPSVNDAPKLRHVRLTYPIPESENKKKYVVCVEVDVFSLGEVIDVIGSLRMSSAYRGGSKISSWIVLDNA